MALYLGENKVKINLDGVVYYLNLFSETPITNGIRLLSSDNYILTDSNGVYLTVKESE
jgi:hemin uptake protein HemP